MEITVSLTAAANALPVGTHQDSVIFVDINSMAEHSRSVILQISPLPGNLIVTPSTNMEVSGELGEVFSGRFQTYTLQNTGGQLLYWRIRNTAPWVTISESFGPLNPGMNKAITIWLNDMADSLGVGNYWITITTSDLINDSEHVRQVSLQITNPIGVLSVSPDTAYTTVGDPGGSFKPETMIYTLTNTRHGSFDWTVSTDVEWLDIEPDSGTLIGQQSTVDVVVSVNQQAALYRTGSYKGQITFANLTGGTEFVRNAVLEVGVKNVLIYAEFADANSTNLEYNHIVNAIKSVGSNFEVSLLNGSGNWMGFWSDRMLS